MRPLSVLAPAKLMETSIMEQCFIMQPFDRSKFDRRYTDVFEPAIRQAGFEPYRVDRDPGVEIPIDSIETGIQQSAVCFAEITTDNPNVWFELGYAIALRKPVCLVSSSERNTPYPFDVRHRRIIGYTTDSLSDYERLKKEIEERLRALLKDRENVEALADLAPSVRTAGLTPHEVAVLTILGSAVDGVEQVEEVRRQANAAGFTELAVALAIRLLVKKNFVKSWDWTEFNGTERTSCKVLDPGFEWLEQNQENLELRRRPVPNW